ncbi:MAG: diacylglycerol kinase [Micrococcales bacterium]|nr:diacylglycerol kinase [Micrococcales bacterium]
MDTPSRAQRIAAWIALLGAALLTVMVLLLVFSRLASLVLAVLGLALLGAGGWWLVTERGARRVAGGVGLAAGLVLIITGLLTRIADQGWALLAALAVVALTALAAGQARMAVAGARRMDGVHFDKPAHPVLIANPKSGGGKVEKFGLRQLAEQHGVEVIILEPGDNLEQLARDAIARGADCLGMAGGDGSQALVASVAIEHDLPFVCVSAGTRNHFALDLGLDRDDPGEGIAAFSHGLERRIDYATVGDRLFVNNVSMGVYATVVQQESYRDAKLETSKELLPELLGARTEPFDLQFTTPDGTDVDGAFVILISNNPYVLGPKLDVAQRRSLTTGRLGVFAINARTGPEAAKLVARSTFGLAGRDPNVHQFDAREFEVRSHGGTAFAGVDGEALDLPTPLTFRIHPGGLRVRVPSASVDRLRRRWARNITLKDLFRVARGQSLTEPRAGGA